MSFELQELPSHFFKNDLWVKKLQHRGLSKKQAEERAQEVARDAYLMPEDIRIRFLRDFL